MKRDRFSLILLDFLEDQRQTLRNESQVFRSENKTDFEKYVYCWWAAHCPVRGGGLVGGCEWDKLKKKENLEESVICNKSKPKKRQIKKNLQCVVPVNIHTSPCKGYYFSFITPSPPPPLLQAI